MRVDEVVYFETLAHPSAAESPGFPQELPTLPNIHDSRIEDQVFTHRSLHARPRHEFEDSPGDQAPDNEV